MELLLKRKYIKSEATIGELYVDDIFECYTLEDSSRIEKVPGKTRIPSGKYEVVINHSPRFGEPMPLLLDVPGFSGIRIHPGNTAEDTEGCILVGAQIGDDECSLKLSKIAYNRLFSDLLDCRDIGEKVYISIMDESQDAQKS